MKDIEITCEVFENMKNIQNVLLSTNLRFVESFILDDIYMYNIENKDFFIKDGKISDTLIIRTVNNKNKEIIYKKRNFNNEGKEISTNKTAIKVEEVQASENLLNALGYERYLRMIDTNYMYENEKYIVYIQEVKELGIFLEVEAKNIENGEKAVLDLIEYVKGFKLNIGTKFDIRKAELLYQVT